MSPALLLYAATFAIVGKAFAILAAAVVFISSMSNAVVFAGFKLNQAEIERLYCVNKGKPKQQCHGKCHLKQQLAENNRPADHDTPKSAFEDGVKLNFFHQAASILPQYIVASSSIKPSTACPAPHSRLFGKSMFQPPDNQALSC